MNALDRHTLPLLVCVCALAGTTSAQCSVTPTDSDGDCIPNSVEDALLSALEPVWVPGETQQPPPQNIGWMLPHGYIQWRDAGTGGQYGWDRERPVSIEATLGAVVDAVA